MDWMIPILQSYGLAGVVIAALGITVWQQNKNAFEVNNHRLAERDVLIKALEANTTAIRENAKVTEARNQVTQDLADAISKQAGAFDIFLQKTEFNQANFKDAQQAQGKALEAFSESNRVNSGILRDIRDFIEGQRE
jgi:7-cyano-7-deazaguanine synthase in queuosine biosynthesis